MFSRQSNLFSFVVLCSLFSFSLGATNTSTPTTVPLSPGPAAPPVTAGAPSASPPAAAAPVGAPSGAPADVPPVPVNGTGSAASGNGLECVSKCMRVKLTEAANWFGQADLPSYCQHAEFWLAHGNCFKDNCKSPQDIEAGKQALSNACGTVKPTITGNSPVNGPHLNGTDANSTASGAANLAANTTHTGLSGPANAPTDSAAAASGTASKPANSSLSGSLPTTSTTSGTSTTGTGGNSSHFAGAVGSAANAAANSSASDVSPYSLGSITFLVGASSGVVSMISLL